MGFSVLQNSLPVVRLQQCKCWRKMLRSKCCQWYPWWSCIM